MSERAGAAPPFDLCIVGAGIAGTVAALRARELGLSFSLLESETPLHRQRPLEGIDRADTVVLEDVSAGASPLVADARLAAASQAGIADWIAELSMRALPLETGVRVFAIELEEPSDGVDEPPASGELANLDHIFRLRVIEGDSGRERRLRARHVVLAIGGREDRDEDADAGLGQRDLTHALSAQALIVGDGQEAIDSLISLAEAKAAASDPHPVYWTPGFRGEPKAEEAEAVEPGTGDRLLEAVRSHFNVRTLAPISNLREQTEVDGTVRVVAEFAASLSPGDSEHPLRLEFDPGKVIRFDEQPETTAESTPDTARGGWPLLGGLPVRIERRDDASLPIVDPRGGLSLAGLYLVGDACGEARLVCDDFAADVGVAQYRRESRDGSIELAASEAVRAVEAIACFDAAKAAKAAEAAEAKDATDSSAASSSGSPDAGATDTRWQIVPIQADGGLGAPTPIASEVFEIGRRGRDLAEPDDAHMADHHASVVCEDGEYFIADSGRGSGVWIRIDEREGTLLENEDQIWVGSQILVASREGEAWTLVHYGDDGSPRETHRLTQSEFTVGRDADISLVRDDSLLSRRHARFRLDGEFLEVFDCGARNGTFVKVTGAQPLADGGEFRLATRGYRFERVR